MRGSNGTYEQWIIKIALHQKNCPKEGCYVIELKCSCVRCWDATSELGTIVLQFA